MNINLKRAIVGLALSFLMGVANAAVNLTTTNLGDLTSYGDIGYMNFFNPPQGLFADTFNFTIPSLSNVNGSLMKIGASTKNFGITGLTLSLGNQVVGQGNAYYEAQLAQGSYSFTVAGNATGQLGGIYAFNAAAVAAPVPEPSSWAMMLGGFGLIGFMSSRRRKYL